MENTNIENSDSLNGESTGTPENNPTEENKDDSGELNVEALKQKNAELSDNNRKLFERAKKAEIEARELKSKTKIETPSPKADIKSQSNEPDYAKLAYLKSEGINHPDDRKMILDESERLKMPLTDILELNYVKERLGANKDARVAKAGMPKGSGRSGGISQQDVDYWLAKGETPDDQELAEKVIDARLSKEKKNKFSDELFVG